VTAVGKVMLAFAGAALPRERDLKALTDRTITDRARLEDPTRLLVTLREGATTLTRALGVER
jgi:DNA-binding IclR family transcriptional regulator